MTARQFRAALRRLGLSQNGLARRIRVHARTVRHWTKDSPVPGAVELLLAAWARYPDLIPPFPPRLPQRGH